MGLDVAVYADDDCETEIASARLGNLDAVVRIRESIKDGSSKASVLLTKVLYSFSHCGDSLRQEEVASVKTELEHLLMLFPDDEAIKEFVADFGRIVDIALQHSRPVTFT